MPELFPYYIFFIANQNSQVSISESRILKVAGFLLNRSINDLNVFFRKILAERNVEPCFRFELKGHNIEPVIETFNSHWAMTHNITVEEDSGYTPLGDIVIF